MLADGGGGGGASRCGGLGVTLRLRVLHTSAGVKGPGSGHAPKDC